MTATELVGEFVVFVIGFGGGWLLADWLIKRLERRRAHSEASA